MQDIVNIMFPCTHFGGDDVDSTDEDTNFTYKKRHRARYFNKTDNKVKRVTDEAHFQDGLNEFKGQRARKILSQALISFDNLDEYETVLDDIIDDIQTDRVTYLADFAKQDDFISLTSSRFNMENMMDDDHGDDNVFVS